MKKILLVFASDMTEIAEWNGMGSIGDADEWEGGGGLLFIYQRLSSQD